MKWFYKWLNKKMKQARDSDNEIMREPDIMPITKSNRIDNERTMTLNVTKANGGWVIENRQYDKRTDRNNNSVHIITDEKDLGEEISKIITFESLYK